MIYNSQFNLSNQTVQPGTLQNIKSRFHHNKASKDVSDFYASWDLMEVTTISNVVALAAEIGADQVGSANFTPEAFKLIVMKLFDKINLFSKWNKTGLFIYLFSFYSFSSIASLFSFLRSPSLLR